MEEHTCEYCETGIIPDEWKKNAEELNKHFIPIKLKTNENLIVTHSMGFDDNLDLVSMSRKIESVPIES